MDELYQVLTTGCSERRAKILFKMKTFLDKYGYEDMLIIHLDYLMINPDIPDRAEKMQTVIVKTGCALLMENGIEVNYDTVYAQPSILYNMMVAINEKIDEWEDYESLLEIMTDGAGYELATVIANIMGDMQPTKYLDAIVRVQDRVYTTIKNFLEAKIRKEADGEDIVRIPQRIVELVKLYVERFPTNKVAEIFTTTGIDMPDADMMRLVDYEFEPAMPKPYYHNIAVAIVGFIIRATPYYNESYPLIEQYAAQLVEPDGVKDMISVCREVNEILELLHSEVDKDEEA